MNSRALVVGASGRMAAEMLARLGISCSVADLFADRDSFHICDGRVRRLDRISDLMSMERFVCEHEFVVFTGGLEGQFSLAKQLANWTHAAFASCDSIDCLSNHERLNEAMTIAGVSRYLFSNVMDEVSCPVVAKKLCRSGSAKCCWENWQSESVVAGDVVQEFIPGQSVSVTFVAEEGVARVLGSSLQLVESFAWVGSISGIEIDDSQMQQALNFANAIVNLSQLNGVFGVDFIRNEKGMFPVDVNPRIPGSAEVVGQHVMEAHIRAFGIEFQHSCPEPEIARGKLVVFNHSEKPFEFDSSAIDRSKFKFESPHCDGALADIPFDTAVIESGWPILTVFASGHSVADVYAELLRRRQGVLEALGVQNR